MKLNVFLLAVFFVVLTSFAAHAANHNETEEDDLNVESVTILASTSMAVPITEISKNYSRLNNIDINTVYDASGELVNKIKEGDPADIIITPSKFYIDQMKEGGLLDPASIKIIAANNLSIVAAKEFKINKSDDIKNILEQIHNKTLMVIANPEDTSLGSYTKQSLEKLDLWKIFEGRVVPAPTATKVVDFVTKGQSAGIVYTTDAILYASQLQLLGQIPPSVHEPVNYYAAIVIGANMDKSKKFMDYLNTAPAKNIFTAHGFLLK